MNQNNKQTIQEKILTAIKAGEVKMRPRWHFVLRSVLLGTGVVLVALVLLYLMSFIIFVLHRNGVWFIPTFGFNFHTIGLFLFSLPWLLIVISLLFIGVLEVLVRQYAFTYRRPLLYSALGIIVFVLIGGAIVAQTSFHSRFLMSARRNELPLAGGLYRNFGAQQMNNVYPCVITAVTERGFRATDLHEDAVEIIVTPQTTFPYGTDFSVGDRVLVIGSRTGDSIIAEGMRNISEMPAPMPMHVRIHFVK